MRSAPRSSSRALPARALRRASPGPHAFAGHELARGAPRLEFPGRGKRGECGIRCEEGARPLTPLSFSAEPRWRAVPLRSAGIRTFSGPVLLATHSGPTRKS